MIYLKKIENEGLENEQVFVFEFENESRVGVGFENCLRMTDEEIKQYEIQKKKKILLNARKLWLASTDWYAARKVKRNINISEEIINKDKLAIEEIDKINQCKTLEELQQFNTNF